MKFFSVPLCLCARPLFSERLSITAAVFSFVFTLRTNELQELAR